MSQPAAPADAPDSGARLDGDEEAQVNPYYDLVYPELSRWRRMQIPLFAAVVYAVTRALGPTVRYEVLGWENVQRAYDAGERIIYAFWHRSIFSALWWWRHRGIVVMNTTNFDGQWTRRVVERFGYLTAQGSSSRGGLKGLAVMARRLGEGHDVAFTIDGPRGPRYVAKPGPVMLARRTGFPIVVFHAGLERAYTLQKSWDLLQLPQPFSRGVILIAPPIHVPRDSDSEGMAKKHAEMQTALERVRDVAEGWFGFPPDERNRLRARIGRAEWNHPSPG